MKCPHCGSERTQTTNLGRRVLAWSATVATSLVLFPIMKYTAKGPARSVGKSICSTKNFICLDCKHEFSCPMNL